ncbi:hypothetical protein OF83DRAFT_1063627 [Amylostereum chailletii]|nr:hypothetical protein OF83DRAFT_1063627 [Amylostereum chailletii]
MATTNYISRLPSELVHDVLRYVDLPADLTSVALADRRLHTMANERLYRDVSISSASQAVKFLLQAVYKPVDPRFRRVRTLSLYFKTTHSFPSLLALIKTALSHLLALKDLKVNLINISSRDWDIAVLIFPENPAFQLQSFQTSLRCHRMNTALSSFIETQMELQELDLSGRSPRPSSPFVLSTAALPRLNLFRTIHCPPDLISKIVSGRPLECISVTLFSEDDFLSIRMLSRSSRPIRLLTVIIIEHASSIDFFANVAGHLPGLEEFHAMSVVHAYTAEMLHAATSILPLFKTLHTIMFLATNAGVSPMPLEEEGALAEAWGRSCPSLKTIALPSLEVWSRIGSKWISSSVPSDA